MRRLVFVYRHMLFGTGEGGTLCFGTIYLLGFISTSSRTQRPNCATASAKNTHARTHASTHTRAHTQSAWTKMTSVYKENKTALQNRNA